MKNLSLSKISFLSLLRTNKGSDWQKSILLVIKIIFFLFLLACLYLALKPAPSNMRESIQEEAREADIVFDTKVLEEIRKREKP